MDSINFKEHFNYIFDHLNNYALVKNSDDSGYSIFHITNQAHFYTQDHYLELIEMLLKENIKVVSDVKELIDPDFVNYSQIWDEDQKKMITLSQKEIPEYMRRKREEKKNKKKE